mgnify:CR=1 FL=1|jgi:hypothetical protein
MNKPFIIFAVLLTITSCVEKKSIFDQNGNIQKLGTPNKVEYFKDIEGKAFQYSDTATFVINDHQELKSVINEIKNADNPEPWKGAGWDRIKVYFIDTILTINTNSKKIGTGASGTFYDLENDNFITKRISKKKKTKR